jgi:hypothetical protein
MINQGNISIHAQNIMPIIKRWLYSDKDIFIRELVSNGCDAISKHKVLVMKGEAAAEENYRVDVKCDKEAGMLTITDNGIGMTAEEVEKYICQVAFSGAEEFLKQYRRHAVAVMLILAAAITPTGDPFTLSIVFIPLYLLYELAIRIVRKAPVEDEDEEEAEEVTEA